MKPILADNFVPRNAAHVQIAAEAPSAALELWLADRDDATAFHTVAWCEAITDAMGHAAHHLVARNDNGAIMGYLPLHHIQSRLFGSALVSTGFAVGGGILADGADVANALADAAWELAHSLGVATLELRGGMLPTTTGWEKKSDSHVAFVAPILGDSDAQLAAIPRKHRAEVRKGLANGLSVTAGRDALHIKAHYAVYAQSVRNLGTPVFPKSLFTSVLEHHDDADILVVWHGDVPIAAVLSLYHCGVVMPYWGGGTTAARALRANEVMYFSLMSHARDLGCTAFDFGRSKTGSGPAAYKKNWGFEPTPLHYAVRHAEASGNAGRDINPNSPKYALKIALWKKMPLWLANRIGPILSRGLG